MTRVITRHLIRRTCRRELAHLEHVRAEASTGDLEAQDECLRLNIHPADTLAVRKEDRRRFRWAVVRL